MFSAAQLQAIKQQMAELEQKMKELSPSAKEYGALARDYSIWQPVAQAAGTLEEALQEKKNLEELAIADDKEMAALAKEDLATYPQKIEPLENNLIHLIQERDAAQEGDALILEIRAGTGGDEAALFGSDLFRMYQRYCAVKSWSCETLSYVEAEIGGVKEAIIAIKGTGCVAKLKFESGVHRVQRVPVTESSGRIHTSAATVAILPEPEEYEVEIVPSDLRVDVFRARGPGGQSVNTTDSAVRITHIPTGLVVSQQDEKSQHKNRAKAMKVLRARLYELEQSKREAERASTRKTQVGSGDRSQRIRTYNFPQGRITDHRIGLTIHALEKILEGGEIDQLLNPLQEEERREKLQNFGTKE
jgi:peptide chain release factor 1